MRIVLLIFLMLPLFANGQYLTPIGATKVGDTSWNRASMRIDRLLRLVQYASDDTNKVLGIDVNGMVVLRNKGGVGGDYIVNDSARATAIKQNGLYVNRAIVDSLYIMLNGTISGNRFEAKFGQTTLGNGNRLSLFTNGGAANRNMVERYFSGTGGGIFILGKRGEYQQFATTGTHNAALSFEDRQIFDRPLYYMMFSDYGTGYIALGKDVGRFTSTDLSTRRNMIQWDSIGHVHIPNGALSSRTGVLFSDRTANKTGYGMYTDLSRGYISYFRDSAMNYNTTASKDIVRLDSNGVMRFLLRPAEYASNFASLYSARSLVDKNYVDSIVAASGGGGGGTGTVTSFSATSSTLSTSVANPTTTPALTINLPNTGTAGSYNNVTTDAQGRVTSGSNVAYATGSDLTSGLATKENTLPTTTTPGTYNNVTVNSKGLVTSGSNVAYLTAEVDGSTTNELQNLSYNSGTNTTQISGGTGVVLPYVRKTGDTMTGQLTINGANLIVNGAVRVGDYQDPDVDFQLAVINKTGAREGYIDYRSPEIIAAKIGVPTFAQIDSIAGKSDSLNGQPASYYLNRANHTNTQAISTVTGLQSALDGKVNYTDTGTMLTPYLRKTEADLTYYKIADSQNVWMTDLNFPTTQPRFGTGNAFDVPIYRNGTLIGTFGASGFTMASTSFNITNNLYFNSTSSNNASINLQTTGIDLSRNTTGSTPAVQSRQRNAAATGAIHEFHNNTGKVAEVTQSGQINGTNTTLFTTGTASGNGSATQIDITLPSTPTWVQVQAGSAAAAGISYVTPITNGVRIFYTVAPASGTSNLTYYIEYR